MTKCERCGKTPAGEYELFDYCAECSKNLCAACMAKGCCGSVPAKSGSGEDHGEDE
jgi:hypothetical protein